MPHEGLIIFNNQGIFGTGDSVIQNFYSQRLIEQGHAGILKGDQNLFIFSRIP